MRITSQLAYKQLKLTRGRSISLILAIVFSTALTTTVSHFVVSGNQMLIHFLGTSYGDYKGAYLALLLIPAALLSVLIIAMSIVVISNVFKVSTKERIEQFGILKSIGATKEQILETVIFESIWVSLIGIPIGLGLGILLAQLTIHVTGYFLEELNQLTQIMINQFEFSFSFVFSFKAILFSALLSFVTVIFSAWLPARQVSKQSAVESIRGQVNSSTYEKKRRNKKWGEKVAFWGPEAMMASKNMERSRKQFKATTIAMSIGIILLISLSQLTYLGNSIEAYMKNDAPENMIVDYVSARKTITTGKNHEQETVIKSPLNSQQGNIIANELSQLSETPVFGMGNDMETYKTHLSQDQLSKEMQVYLNETEKLSINKLDVEIITIDELHYDSLCKTLNIPQGSNILINDYEYNDFGKLVNLEPYGENINQMTLFKADGSEKQIAIQGILNRDQMMPQLFYPNKGTVRIIVPQAMVRAYTWYALIEDDYISDFTQKANGIMDTHFHESEGSDYMASGFSTRVYQIDDYMKVMNIAVMIASVLLYSFSAVLLLIGFTNVVTTLSTNVLMRAKEFAILKSIGMTPESLKKMINIESLLCSLKALAYGIPMGLLLSYLIQLPVRLLLPIAYRIPWMTLLICSVGILVMTRTITTFAIKRLKKQNIIETIRAQSGK